MRLAPVYNCSVVYASEYCRTVKRTHAYIVTKILKGWNITISQKNSPSLVRIKSYTIFLNYFPSFIFPCFSVVSFFTVKIEKKKPGCFIFFHYAKPTGQRSVGIPKENETTFSFKPGQPIEMALIILYSYSEFPN